MRLSTSGGVDDSIGAFGLRNRFLAAVTIDPDTGCWLWQRPVNRDGYGSLRVVKVFYGAHVYAYTAVIGPVPEGLELDHTCNVRRCANPWHGEPVTPDENKRRAAERRTMCKGGRHPRTSTSQYMSGSNKGRCKHCCAESTRKYLAKRKAS